MTRVIRQSSSASRLTAFALRGDKAKETQTHLKVYALVKIGAHSEGYRLDTISREWRFVLVGIPEVLPVKEHRLRQREPVAIMANV